MDTKSQLSFGQQLALLFEHADDQTRYRQLIADLWQRLAQQIQLPAVVGISGGQGSGKTTLARLLVKFAQEQGIPSGFVSLDDYYLDQQHRMALAKNIHPLFARRGMPGTHRIQQAIADAQAVLQGQAVSLPRFDKALDQPVASFQPQTLSLLLVEGWCVGLTPQSATQLAQAQNPLELNEDATAVWRHAVNQFLAADYQQYWDLCGKLIWLKAPGWAAICRWRAQQEQELWQSRGQGMSEPELQHFMHSFERLTAHSFGVLPSKADIIVELDMLHRPKLL